MKKVNNVLWGLFPYPSLWRNIKNIPRAFKRVMFTLKHGYAPQARWETFAWFMDVMKEILIWHRNDKVGMPIVIDNYNFDGSTDEENSAVWNNVLDTMIDCLNKMDEDNSDYDDMELNEKYVLMDEAKDEFFKLFNDYFYDLWD